MIDVVCFSGGVYLYCGRKRRKNCLNSLLKNWYHGVKVPVLCAFSCISAADTSNEGGLEKIFGRLPL